MIFSYRNSSGVLKNFSTTNRILILRGMSDEDEAMFCASLEKAFSSDPLISCDDWDRRKESAISGECILTASVQDDNIDALQTYGFETQADGSIVTYYSKQLVFGVRYIGGDNYSCFTSITDDERVEDLMSRTLEVNPSRYNKLPELLEMLPTDSKHFVIDLFSDISRRFDNAKKVLILPNISVLNDEAYGLLAYALASVREAVLIILSDSEGLGNFKADYADEIEYVK